MEIQLRVTGAALTLTLLAHAASAQDGTQTNKVVLPTIDVSGSRLGATMLGNGGNLINQKIHIPESI